MEDCHKSTTKLQLYRCNKCSRSFFSDERRTSHFEAKHLNSINIKWKSHKIVDENQNAPMEILRKKTNMTRTEAMFSTLLSNWPPENAYPKLQSRHRISKKRLDMLLKRWLSKSYSPLLHGSLNAKKVLSQEYSKDSMLTQERINDLTFLTGLSCRFIKLWFHWKKIRGHLSSGDQLLYKSFLSQPYPDDASLQMLMTETGLLLSRIRLWFRVSRAKYRIMEFKEVEEKVLWAWFLKGADSALEEKEMGEVATLVGMNIEDVKTIFKYWSDAWFIADVPSKEKLLMNSQEICDRLGIDVTKHENVLNALEKARNNQKMFGIPICCKVIETGNSEQVSANFPFLKTYFESYLEKDKVVPYQSNEDLDEKDTDSDNEECSAADHSQNEKGDTPSSSSVLHNDTQSKKLLVVQSDVLRQTHSGSPRIETENEEQNLYSLFNKAPSYCVETDCTSSSPEQHSSFAGYNLSSSEYCSTSSEVEESTCDSGNESDSSDDDDNESTSAAEYFPEKLDHKPYTFIDLTLDSDHNSSDQEEAAGNCSQISDAVPDSNPLNVCEFEEITDWSPLGEEHTVGDNRDNCQSPSNLVICESDEEVMSILHKPITELTQSIKTDSSGYENNMVTMNVDDTRTDPQLDVSVELSLTNPENDVSAKLQEHPSPEIPFSHSHNTIIPPTSLQARLKQESSSKTKSQDVMLIGNSFKKLHCKRRAIYIEPISLSRRSKEKFSPKRPLHHRKPKSTTRSKHLHIAKTLFSKSFSQCKLSPYTELKKSLHKRNKS
uniref:uncharacterized protein LOC120340609 isoform X1 n=1 Tax=Styela clava TaxID=7725 RepID=UPI00193A25EA|nr:uncharacterized protein LOC120340609 isoform X1 [Styela clava]